MSSANTARLVLLQQMEASLKVLTNSLSDTVDTALPKNLGDLRETIQNIQKSLAKKEQPLSLSQTERAIISRDNEGATSRLHTVDEDKNNADPVRVELEAFQDMSNPEFILADFLSKY